MVSGGKKIRSKILVDIGSIFKINYKKLIILGAAVECIHAYSLIHDDLPCMDNDSIRRGKPSTHIKFGESTAVLAGNSLLTMAFEILSHKDLNLSEKIKIKLINKISESSGHLGIAGGQYLDLSFEHKKVSRKKTIKWLKELGNPYEDILIDKNGKIAIDWGVYGIPETFIINSNGIIKYRHVGPITNKIYKKI